MKIRIGSVLMFTLITLSPVFADVDVSVNYRDRNPFNVISDWSVGIGKNREDRDRIVKERIDYRAERRRLEWERRHHYDRQDRREDHEYHR